MVQIFDELSDTLCKVADLSEFIRLGHPHSYYTHSAEDACVAISGVVEK
jgi:mitochondrial intermediate peptidase